MINNFSTITFGKSLDISGSRCINLIKESLPFSLSSISFNKVTYQQVDGVAMGSLLGLILADKFVGAVKRKVFLTTKRPVIYIRYRDDTLA